MVLILFLIALIAPLFAGESKHTQSQPLIAPVSAEESLPELKQVFLSRSIDNGSQDLRECAIDCFAKNRLPLDPQSTNKTLFEDVHREFYSIADEQLQTLLSYRGPRENNYMQVFYNLKRNSSISIEREGRQIDVFVDPRRGLLSGQTESMLAAYRRRQATCIWNCNPILNKLRGTFRKGEELSLLDRFGSYDRWTFESIGIDAWIAIVSSSYPVTAKKFD